MSVVHTQASIAHTHTSAGHIQVSVRNTQEGAGEEKERMPAVLVVRPLLRHHDVSVGHTLDTLWRVLHTPRLALAVLYVPHSLDSGEGRGCIGATSFRRKCIGVTSFRRRWIGVTSFRKGWIGVTFFRRIDWVYFLGEDGLGVSFFSEDSLGLLFSEASVKARTGSG